MIICYQYVFKVRAGYDERPLNMMDTRKCGMEQAGLELKSVVRLPSSGPRDNGDVPKISKGPRRTTRMNSVSFGNMPNQFMKQS